MVGINIQIPNLAKIQRALSKFPKNTAKYINIAIEKSLRQIQRRTIPLTPHKTGELERSILRGIEIRPLAGRVYSDKEYAEEQHENTRFKHPIKGQAKFLEKGVALSENDIKDYFKDALEKAVEDIEKQSK